ncbi:MAG: TldD/PmbA family protein [Firmicutes bacterium]|nr:TldD/PmbA family protein [Bacillota bacterium]
MLNDILRPQTALFEGGFQTVLRGHENRNRRVVLLKGNLTANSRSEARGVSARVGKDGLYGFASAAEYSPEAAARVLQAAKENALLLDRHAKARTPMPPALAQEMIPLNREIADAEQKRIIEVCKTLDDYVAKTYPDLLSRTIVYTEDSQDRIVYASDACCGHVTSPRCYVYVMMTMQAEDGTPVELFKALGGSGCFDDRFSDLTQYYPQIEDLYKKVKDKTHGVHAEAGLKQVVLGGMMGGMLAHEAVGHTVEADLVMGGSVAGPNLGKRVASDLVTLVDFAHTYNGAPAPLPVFLDDEGVKAEDAVLIKDGILTGYMNNRETAEKYGQRPAGNARAWAYADEPLIRMRNTCILPGKNTLEELIASVDDGYYLVDSRNGQADLTGEFMFGVACGYEIKHGKLGRALLDTTVSGVAFDMLKTVDMVSDTVEWSSSGFCGKKQMIPVGMGGPCMRCKIMIGGR